MVDRARQFPQPGRKLLFVAVVACFAGEVALANPVGPAVVNGTVGFATVGKTLTVTNTPSAIINWQGFSIGAGETTRFAQQSAQSAVLNRVVGQDPSAILGTLSSNGRVFLLNPNGILFGAGSRVDVAGLVASTLNLSNQDFLAGRLNFEAGPVANLIINYGNIATPAGGRVYMIAPNIENHGVITAPGGEVMLAAGKTVKLVEADVPNLRVELTAGGEALNVGAILTDGGKAGIYAALIDQRGIVRADTVQAGARGEIQLRASRNITLAPGSVISASGAPGGVHDGGTSYIVSERTLDMQRGSVVRVEGGMGGGNGGFLEFSGRGRMLLDGQYSARALASGFRSGTLYFDPANVDIFSGLCTVGLCLNPATQLTGGNIVIDATNDLRVLSAVADSNLDAGASLTLNAGNNLTVSAPIGAPGAGRFDHDLALNAGNDVVINSDIYLGNRTLTLAADATIPSVGAVTNGVGDVIIFDPVSRTYSHFNDFTRASNPTPGGTWTYGFMTALGGALTLYDIGDCCTWFHSVVNSVNTPAVSQGSFHPGQNNEYSVIRFTAPAAGIYDLSSTFTPFDPRTTTDVHILRGGTSLFSGNTIGATSTSQAFSSTLTLAAGQTIDFAVGFGPDDYRFDTTGVSVKLIRPPFVVDTLGSINVSGVNFKVLGGANKSAAVRASGNIIVNSTGAVTIQAGPAIADKTASSSAASVSAGNSINITAASLTVKGGNSSEASATGAANANADANASASLTAAQSIAIAVSGAVLVQGGSHVEASASVDTFGVTVAAGQRTASMNANASIAAGGNLTLNAGSLTVSGGTEVEASAAGTDSGSTTSASGPYTDTATTTSNASLTAGSNLNITVSGAVAVNGGTNASASATDSSVTGTKVGTASANAIVSANGSLSIQAGSLTVSGGDGAEVEASDSGSNSAAANATATINAAQMLTLTIGGAMAVKGGNAIEAVANFDALFNVDPAPARNDAMANVNANILAGSDLVISAAALTVTGGAMTASSPYPNITNANPVAGRTTDTNSVTVDTNALLSAGRDASVTVTAGSFALAGGQHGASDRVLAEGLDNNSATANANAKIISGRNLTVGVTGGNVNISGGTVNACGPMGVTPACAAGGNNAAVANANAEMIAGGVKSISATGNLVLAGGTTITGLNGTASAFALLDPGAMTLGIGGSVFLTGGTGPSTSATISATGPITLTSAGGWVLAGGPGSGLFPASSSPIIPGTFAFTLDALRADAKVITFASPPPPPPPIIVEIPIPPPPPIIVEIPIPPPPPILLPPPQQQAGAPPVPEPEPQPQSGTATGTADGTAPVDDGAGARRRRVPRCG